MTKGFHRFARKVALALVLGLVVFAGNGLAHERAQAPDGQGGVTLLEAGGSTTCGLRPDGTAVCWGFNGSGNASPPPGEHFVQLSAGANLACGLRADGRALCWGHTSYTAVPAGEVFRSLATGDNFACGLRSNGSVVCWGDNGHGQATPPPSQVFVDIEANGFTACGLRADGSALCWGYNGGGQTSVPAGEVFAALSVGYQHACGLRADGSLRCWGSNTYGESTPPAGVAFLTVSAGTFHTCGLRADRGVNCWGNNGSGQAQSYADGGTSYIAVTTGAQHSCAVDMAGRVKCWGDNQSWQRGVFDVPDARIAIGTGFGCAVPGNAGVSQALCWGANDFGQATPPTSETFQAIAAGAKHACALRADGSVRCWGGNDSGQASAPTGAFQHVATGGTHSCGVRADGTVACWGNNVNGQTAAPTGSFRHVAAGAQHSCAVRTNGSLVCWGGNTAGQTDAPAGTGFDRVSVGDWLSCGLRTDQTVACWGGYWSAPAADEKFTSIAVGRVHACGLRASDLSVRCWGHEQFGKTLPPPGQMYRIAAGDDTSCGLRLDGQLVCWGYQVQGDNASGPFGLGSVVAGSQHSCSRTPGMLAACWGDNSAGQLTSPDQIPLALDVGDRHTCALRHMGYTSCWGRTAEAQTTLPMPNVFKALRAAPYGGCGLRANGTLACWGLNNYGQATPPPGVFRAVDAGYFHACAVSAAGTAGCWGYNADGQATAPAGNYVDVAVGDHHSCGLRSDGTIACWGRTSDGATAPPAGTFNVLASGRFHACAIRTNGTLTCWGANDAGQATPPATGLYTAVSAGMSHSCAIRDDGARVCWGSNAAGANPDLAVMPATFPGGVHGDEYPLTFLALAGPNYTASQGAFGVVAGALPPGLALDAYGALYGTPTTVGSYAFTVEGEDSNGFLASREYTIVIADPSPPLVLPTVTGTLGDNGWYRGNVGISWTLSDAQSPITASTGCTPSTLSTDSPGAGYTCTATSAGGTASETVTAKRDATLPTISSGTTTQPNAAGWYKAAVTLKYLCSDATSGVASCPVDDVMSTDGAGLLSPARSVTDAAGNVRAVARRTVNIDTVAPESAFNTTPPAQSNSAQATFDFFATDALSFVDALLCSLDGAAFTDCGSPITLAGLADGTHTFAIGARDVAGNIDASPAMHTWTIDTDDTPPVIAPVVSGTLGDNGWYVGNVSVAWNVSDAESAVGSSSGCNTVVLSTDTPGATFTCTASSTGGSANASVTVKLDKTAPQVAAEPTSAANAAGWYRGDVTIGHACSDALSGVVACPANQVLAGEGSAVASAPRTARDAAGNVSGQVSATVRIDRTAPVLAPTVAQPLLLNAVAAAQANAGDALSGIATQSCAALSTGSVGTKGVACTATDAAGNTGSASAGYRVQYGFAGFEAPLDHAWNGVRVKQYLPFVWRVFDANNADVAGIANVTFAKANIACPAGINPVPVAVYGDANTTLQYLGGGRYRRNWLMPSMLPSSCVRLTLDLGDGVPRVLQVKL